LLIIQGKEVFIYKLLSNRRKARFYSKREAQKASLFFLKKIFTLPKFAILQINMLSSHIRKQKFLL